MKLFLSSSVYPILDFPPTVCWNLFVGLLDIHKAPSFVGDGQNWWLFLVGGRQRKTFVPPFHCYLSLHFMFSNADCHKYLNFLEENNFHSNVMGILCGFIQHRLRFRAFAPWKYAWNSAGKCSLSLFSIILIHLSHSSRAHD